MDKETLEEVKDLAYWKNNADEAYLKVPISVLRYITELEERMYSEEDMIEFAVWLYLEVGSNKGKERTNKELFKEWFEQSKKK